MLKVVIAEDDEVVRKQVINLVSALGGYDIVYSTGNGADLLNSLKRIKPDIVISDISMPGMTGIEAIHIIRHEMPDAELVFITQHFEIYIKQIIQLYSFDTVEKPLNTVRLQETLERIKNKLMKNERLIEFKSEGSVVVLKARDLYFVEAVKKKARVNAENNTYLSNYPLKEFEDILTPDSFFKSSRSHIVNLQKVRGIKPDSRTSFQIVFDKKEYVAYLSKNLYEDFRLELKKHFN